MCDRQDRMGGIIMKPTDLMLNDWVLWNNRYVQIVRTCAYAYYNGHRDVWLAHCNDDNFIECRDISTISPIPLTYEILKKNGFSPETFLTAEWEKEVYFKEFSSCVVEPDDSGKYIFGTTIYWNKTDGDGSPIDWGTMYDSRIYNLQYVHELQHALRLCGLDELADNFKI